MNVQSCEIHLIPEFNTPARWTTDHVVVDSLLLPFKIYHQCVRLLAYSENPPPQISIIKAAFQFCHSYYTNLTAQTTLHGHGEQGLHARRRTSPEIRRRLARRPPRPGQLIVGSLPLPIREPPGAALAGEGREGGILGGVGHGARQVPLRPRPPPSRVGRPRHRRAGSMPTISC